MKKHSKNTHPKKLRKRKDALSKADRICQRLMLKAGRYYQPAELFYQRLWRERLHAIGFRAYHVERLDPQPVWDIRLTGSLTAQAYLLLSRPAKQWILLPNLLEKQLKAEIQQMAKEMGPPIKSKFIHVSRGEIISISLSCGTPANQGSCGSPTKNLTPSLR